MELTVQVDETEEDDDRGQSVKVTQVGVETEMVAEPQVKTVGSGHQVDQVVVEASSASVSSASSSAPGKGRGKPLSSGQEMSEGSAAASGATSRSSSPVTSSTLSTAPPVGMGTRWASKAKAGAAVKATTAATAARGDILDCMLCDVI